MLANQLIDFMVEIRLLTSTKVSNGSRETHFLIPLQLRGRPSFWQDCLKNCDIPTDTDMSIKAVRFKLLRGIVTVPSFLRLMSEFCHDIAHMWGCAFMTRVGAGQNVFVRLSEDRSAVDVISLAHSAEAAQSASQLNEIVGTIISMLKMSTENSIELHLCPHCLVTNHYMRSGLAHEFHKKQLGRSVELRLNCRRHHEESVANIILGTTVQFRGKHLMPLLFPGTQPEFIPWMPVSQAGITCYTQPIDSHSDEHAGIVLPNSFFALSHQLEAGSKIDRAALDQILLAMCASAPACPVAIEGNLVSLLLQYSVGDTIGSNTIHRIINFSLPIVVAPSAASQSGASASRGTVLKAASPHGLSERQQLVVDFKHKGTTGEYGLGVVVCQIVDDFTFVIEADAPRSLVDWDTSNRIHVKPGTRLFTVQPSFSFADKVVVVFASVLAERSSRPKFALFPGSPSGFEVAFLTQQRCCGRELGSVWTEVEDNWAIMLGNEYQNYEMDSVTLFRNRARDQQFSEEVNWLKTIGQARPNPDKYPYESFSCASDDAQQRALRSSLQRQVLGNFREFRSKFCLLPFHEDEGLNLSVVWCAMSCSCFFFLV